MGKSLPRDEKVLPERRKGPAWRDHEIVLLIVLRAKGVGFHRIARKLGRSPGYCKLKHWRLSA